MAQTDFRRCGRPGNGDFSELGRILSSITSFRRFCWHSLLSVEQLWRFTEDKPASAAEDDDDDEDDDSRLRPTRSPERPQHCRL